MKSFKQKLIERLQQDDDVPLEQSPLPNPFPVWNPFPLLRPTPAGPPEWDTDSAPWHNLPPNVIHDLIEAWAWHIFNTTGSWPDWYEPGEFNLDQLDERMKEKLLRWYRQSNPFRPGGRFGDPIR